MKWPYVACDWRDWRFKYVRRAVYAKWIGRELMWRIVHIGPVIVSWLRPVERA